MIAITIVCRELAALQISTTGRSLFGGSSDFSGE